MCRQKRWTGAVLQRQDRDAGTVPIPQQEYGDGGDPGEQGQSRGTAGQGPREHHTGRMHKHPA